jgi:hypothetical protein
LPEPMRYEVRNEEVEKVLKTLGDILKDVMPPGYGFTLLIFQFNGPELFYISGANRADMIKTMREFIAKFEEN